VGLPDAREGGVLGGVDGVQGAAVARDLRLVPPAEEALHQLGGGDHLDAVGPDQLERAGVDAREVRDRPLRAVLHCDPRAGPEAAQQLRERGAERLPGRVGAARAGDLGREGSELDRVHERHRLARARHEVEPAPGEHVAGEAERGHRGGVLAVEVVEEPRVELLLRERQLQGGEVHGRAYNAARGDGRKMKGAATRPGATLREFEKQAT